MTTKKLIKHLLKADPKGTRTVYLQSDAEGNGYEPARTFWLGAIDRNTGDVGIEALTDEDRAAGYTEDDVKKGKKIFILVP